MQTPRLTPQQQAEFKLYSGMYYSYTGRKTYIMAIPVTEDELGYTSSDEVIHLAIHHPMMIGLNEDEKPFFRMGVFVHEMLHQIFTDFRYMETILHEHPWRLEREIILLFANLVEDPAIEYWAETEIAGQPLAALRFMIITVYRKSELIENANTPFTQLATALIQFGDMGLLKGEFTFDEAREAFIKIAPEFNSAILNPDSRARIDCAVHWADLTRPLWAREEEKEEKELLDELQRLRENECVSDTKGGGSTPITPDPDDKPSSGIAERRSNLARQIREQDNAAGQGAPGQPGSTPENGEGQAESGHHAADGNANQDPPQNGGGENDSNDGMESGDGSGSHADKDGDPTLPGHYPAYGGNETDTEGGIDEAMLEIDKTAIEENAKAIQSIADFIKKQQKDNIEYKSQSSFYGNVRCLQNRVIVNKHDQQAFQKEYADILMSHAEDIRSIYTSMSRIFIEDTGETVRSTTGKYNIMRAAKQTTAKIFDRRIAPKKMDSLAIMILVDESGSMYGIKEQMARETTIILSEALAKLKVPCYIMGFTTDDKHGYDAVHDHYVTWANTPGERISLVGIHAQCNNFDGYSIRNAADILRKKHAEHKILFVISDGYPASRKYKSREDAIADTTSAIIEAGHTATVLGIGIGDGKPAAFQHMYKGAFVQAQQPQELTQALVHNLLLILKKARRN